MEIIYQTINYILNPNELGFFNHTLNKVFHKDVELFDLFTFDDIEKHLFISYNINENYNLIIRSKIYISRLWGYYHQFIQTYKLSYKVLFCSLYFIWIVLLLFRWKSVWFISYRNWISQKIDIDDYIKIIRLLKSFGKEKKSWNRIKWIYVLIQIISLV